MSVGALEPKFYAQLVSLLGLDQESLPAQYDRGRWSALRTAFAEVFATKSRAEWEVVFAGTDACVTPVLTFGEAATHPHLVARGTVTEVDGVPQHAPTPRFSRSATGAPRPPTRTAADIDSVWPA